jgi:small subunit ribosomal protein S17
MRSADQQGGTGRRALTGIVASRSGAKSVSVVINRLARHPIYGKYMRRRTRLAVHDPGDAAGVGDLVEVVPCRRVSRTKSWRLVRVVRKAAGVTETVAEESS